MIGAMSGAASITAMAMDMDIGLQLGSSGALDDAPTSNVERNEPPASAATLRTDASARAASASASASASDTRRLRAMMTAHFAFIWRTLERLGVPRADVDDSAQQVFLVASRRLASIDPEKEGPFLFGTAMNVAAEVRRTNLRRRAVQVGHTSDARESLHARDPSALPDELLDRARARETLDLVLASMPMDLRAAFVLYELEELPIHRIAALLNIPLGTAASRLRRARTEFERLVARLQTSGARHGGGAGGKR